MATRNVFRICPWCRAQFQVRGGTRKYCCAECQFWDAVRIDPESGCWNVQGTPIGVGYRAVRQRLRKDGTRAEQFAHRFSWVLYRGPIPPGLVVDHRVCRNKQCANPDHLVVCTIAENLAQPDGGAAVRRARTHCKRGHPFSGDNLYVDKRKGNRVCKECARRNQRRRYLLTEAVVGWVPPAERTHCKWGHVFAGENLRIAPNGARVCRACATATTRRHRAKRMMGSAENGNEHYVFESQN